jgi:hypothetical protein
MKCAVEMASDGMTFIPIFIEIDIGVRKLLGGGGKQTQTHIDTERAR